MKKLIAILFMGVLLFSLIPLGVMAEENKEDIKDSERAGKLNKMELREYAMKRREDIQQFKDRIKNAETKEERLKIMDERRERFKANLEESRMKLKDNKEKLVVCRGKLDETCSKLKQEYKENSAVFLLNAADRMIEHLEKLKEKISSNGSETEAKKELITKIDARITKLQEIRTEIENLGENPSKEDVKRLAKELRVGLGEVKMHNKSAMWHNFSDRFAGILVKSEHLKTRLDKVLAKLEEKGLNTTNVEVKINEFNTHIEDAKKLHKEAKAKIEASSSPSEVQELMKKSKEHLKLAHSTLKELVKEIKNMNEGQKVLKEVTAESLTA